MLGAFDWTIGHHISLLKGTTRLNLIGRWYGGNHPESDSRFPNFTHHKLPLFHQGSRGKDKNKKTPKKTRPAWVHPMDCTLLTLDPFGPRSPRFDFRHSAFGGQRLQQVGSHTPAPSDAWRPVSQVLDAPRACGKTWDLTPGESRGDLLGHERPKRTLKGRGSDRR